MARDIMHNLSSLSVERIFSSPLSRAMETASPLARTLGLDVIADARLMEIDFGAYEGKSKRDLGLKLRKVHAHVPVPGGEALIDVWQRAGDFLRDLPSTDRHTVIVGHFWLNRMIFGHMAYMDFATACRSRDYRPHTGSIIEMKFGGPDRAEINCNSFG